VKAVKGKDVKFWRVAPAIIATVLLGCLVLTTSSCAVGNEYGYDPEMATPASYSPTVPVDFDKANQSFLKLELSANCDSESEIQIQRQSYSDYSDDYMIRGLRGCVIKQGQQWELLQISFTKTGDNESKVSVILDGWLASGLSYPEDSQFTESMEPGYSDQLQKFSRQMASDYASYLQNGVIQ
jgi:hypothetical protein